MTIERIESPERPGAQERTGGGGGAFGPVPNVAAAGFITVIMALVVIAGTRAQTDPLTYTYFVPIVSRAFDSRPGLSNVSPEGCSMIGRYRPAWFYDWGGVLCPNAAGEYVDMIWSSAVNHTFTGAGVLLGYNEPDQPYQANMTPRQAAEDWTRLEAINPAVLVSPSPSQLHPEWLWEMVKEYRDLYGHPPRFDAIASHFYGPGSIADYLTEFRRQELASGYDVPIWVTEFGACDVGWMHESITWMSAQIWIGRWAWFTLQGWPDSCFNLVDAVGVLTPLGAEYFWVKP